MLGVYAIVIGLFVAAIAGIAQLATLMPQYADQFQEQLSGLKSWLAGMGVTQADIQNALEQHRQELDRRLRRRACCPASRACSPRCSSSSRC